MSRLLPVQFSDLPPGLSRLKGSVVIRRGVHRTTVFKQIDTVVRGKRHCTRQKVGVAHDQASLEKLVLKVWSERGLVPRPNRLPTYEEAAEMYKSLQMNTNSKLGVKALDYGVKLAPWRHTKIDEISRTEIASWYSANVHVRPAAARRCVRVTRTILKWAYNFHDLDRSNPATGFRLIASGETTKAIADLPAFRALVDKLTPFKRAFYLLAIFTGARRASLLDLEWRDVDLQHETITFRTMKGGQALTIPMNRQTREALSSLPRINSKVLAGIQKVALTDGKSLAHRCRASFISAGVAAGVDRELRMMLVGHKTGSDPHSGYITRDVLQATLRPASQKIGDWLEARMLSTC